MKKIINLLVCVTFCMTLPSCGAFFELANSVTSEYVKYVDNNNDDPIGLYDQAMAWSKGNVGKGLVATELGLSVIDEYSKKDLSVVRSIVQGTRNSYLGDDNLGDDDKVDLVGTLFYGAAQTADYYEWKNFQERLEAYELQKEDALNPESPNYDPYFEFRYIVDMEKRKIYKVSNIDAVKAIRKYEESERTAHIDYQLIEYGIISEFDYETLFATEELKNQNEDLYRKYCFELGILRLNERFNNIGNEAGHHEEQIQVEEYLPANQPTSAVDDSSCDIKQNDTMHHHNNNIAEQIEAIVVDHYAFDAYKLSAEQEAILNELATLMKSDNTTQITIVGHTCHIGTDKANMNVGRKRAYYAQQYLVANGVEENRIQIKSAGATDPYVDKGDIESRLKNRRITFEVERR